MLEFLQYYANWIVYPGAAAVFSAFFTFFAIRLLPRLGYVDKPGGRHIHQRIVPRGGGIAIILSFFLVLGILALEQSGPVAELWKRLLPPSLLLGGLGMVDDRFELSSWIKLLVQLLVALIVWSMGAQTYSVFGWTVPWYLSLTFTAVWIIIILNSFNLIDGLDGLASGLAIVSGGCMTIWFLLIGGHDAEAVTMLVLAGACLGFLRYNFYPARIFLGDTGSTFLGLIFAVIGLSTIDHAVTATSLLLPLLAIGVPLFDVILAIWRRSMRKLLDPHAGGIMDGDQDHLHHRLFKKTHKQATTALIMYLLGCGFAAGVLLLLVFRTAAAIAYIILLLAVLLAIRQLAGVELSDSARLIQNGLSKPRRGLLINLVHPFIDFALIGIAFLTAHWCATDEIGNLKIFVYCFCPLALVLCFSGIYRVYWLRAGVNDYCRLALLILSGTILSSLLLFCGSYEYIADSFGVGIRQFVTGSLLFITLATLLIVSERLIIHYAGWFWFHELYVQRQPPELQRKLVIYGGGLKCRVYINCLYCAKKADNPERIVGIIDDDPRAARTAHLRLPRVRRKRPPRADPCAAPVRQAPGHGAYREPRTDEPPRNVLPGTRHRAPLSPHRRERGRSGRDRLSSGPGITGTGVGTAPAACRGSSGTPRRRKSCCGSRSGMRLHRREAPFRAAASRHTPCGSRAASPKNRALRAPRRDAKDNRDSGRTAARPAPGPSPHRNFLRDGGGFFHR